MTALIEPAIDPQLALEASTLESSRTELEHGHRKTTSLVWRTAVERTIGTMREHLAERLTLAKLAETAVLSPYHFNRVFSHVTGLPPGIFLTALRLECAKRLLVLTHFSVTRICLDVGYQSLGTFSTQFAQLVGVQPSRLRSMLPALTDNAAYKLALPGAEDVRPDASPFGVMGRVSGFDVPSGPVFVGLFARPVPQGNPFGCAVLPCAGRFRVQSVPDGRYYPLAVAIPWRHGALGCTLPDYASIYVGAAPPVEVHAGVPSSQIDIFLRPALPTDPPIVVALPALFLRHAQNRNAGCKGDDASRWTI